MMLTQKSIGHISPYVPVGTTRMRELECNDELRVFDAMHA